MCCNNRKGGIIMEFFWQMFTTTLGSAAVIASLSALFFSSKKRSALHKSNKGLHRVVLALFFGILSIYASVSAVKVESGALCNCRNLAPLYAGMVGGPVAGLGAALIGGLFRYFVYGGESAWPCMLACFFAGVVGYCVHLLVKKEHRYSVLTGVIASVVTEGVHMLFLCAFGQSAAAAQIVIPIMLSNILGLAFCLYIYKRFDMSTEG